MRGITHSEPETAKKKVMQLTENNLTYNHVCPSRILSHFDKLIFSDVVMQFGCFIVCENREPKALQYLINVSRT